MKKNKLFLAVVMLAAIVLNSCSKYDENPMLAIGTKTGRITGEWKLSEMEYMSTTSSGSGVDKITYTTTKNYDGKMMTYTTSGGTPRIYSYSETMTIEKDGTYIMNIIDDGETEEYTNYWSWFDGSSSKEMIMLDDLYQITKLTGKELVLTQNFTSSNSDPETRSSTLTITYTKE